MVSLKSIKKVAASLLLPLIFQAFVVSGSLAAVDAAVSHEKSFRIPVCTLTGMKWLVTQSVRPIQDSTTTGKAQSNQSDSDQEPTSSAHEHCSMCSALAAMPVTPHQHNPAWIQFQTFYPAFGLQQPHRVEACRPPPSQAPPVFS